MKWRIEYTLITVIFAFVGITFLLSKKADQVRSFLGREDLPRGIRNNNPGNLILTNIGWQGKIPNHQNTDGHFEQFTQFRWGIRAMIKDIKASLDRGDNTIEAIMYEYAPPSENNTENYIAILSDQLGISRHTPIAFTKSQMKPLAMAIEKVENGKNYMTDSDFNQAWDLL